MKKWMRILAVATLGLYVGLVVTETFHGFAAGHTESHCVLCQVAHQTPVIGQATPRLEYCQNFRRIVLAPSFVTWAEAEASHYGRAPPLS